MSGTYRIELRHNFETAHRLAAPGSPIKCMSIHGHSWMAVATVVGRQLDNNGILVEFGAFKAAWRRWLDDNIDHALVLQRDDPMAAAVRGVYPESRIYLLDHSPTTEVLAEHLWQVTSEILRSVADPQLDVKLENITLHETRVNTASWSPD
jgi:6-pyruvoyltetrahydropterin/6-carboxytetrahydropterin synthase